jgi:hypothetical protein
VNAESNHWPQIGQLFVQQGYLTTEDLNSALAHQQTTGQLLGEILVARGHITRLDLASAIGTQWNWPQEPTEFDVADQSRVAKQPEQLAVDQPSVEPEAFAADSETFSATPMGDQCEPQAHPADPFGDALSELVGRVAAVEEKAGLVDDLQARLPSVTEHQATTDARLDTLESMLSESTRANAELKSELESHSLELEALRASATKLAALTAAARAFLS